MRCFEGGIPSFEIGSIRPPSEGGSASLLLRVTRNCPWNRCKFCYGTPYNREKFQLRSVEEVKKDIDAVKAISDEIKSASWRLGAGGQVNKSVGATIIQNNRWLGVDPCFATVFNWLYSGAETVFLQDANTPIMRTADLVEVIEYLKQTFPSLERVTSYARSKTIFKKTPDELRSLREAGLTRLHIGLETGDDELLKYMDKGVTAAEHIEGGRKAIEAGLELSEYVMPGLGGKTMSERHARETAQVLNKINPHYIRLRPLVPRRRTPLFEIYQSGEFQLLSPHEELREIKLLVEGLEVESRLCFDHMRNPTYKTSFGLMPLFHMDYEGYKFPEEKARVLTLLEEGLQIKESLFISSEDLIGVDTI
jgi:radical SAM superfamily enzyme YgiQ (UPF0313 family)